ncbi:MAG: hypothetical protein J6C23_04960 [Clostridia bacterium]|nr:hypothetical protein [Clostridia bacterium]
MKKRIQTFFTLLLTLCLLVFSATACDNTSGVFKFSDEFLIEERNVTIQVGSETSTLYFPDKITVSGNASYKVYSDLECTKELVGKEVSLNYGNNLYYILATVNGKDILYHVTINRKGSSAGTLDVSLAYKKNINNSWTKVEGGIYDGEIWEPGNTVVRYFRIRNEGSLDLKYKLSIKSNVTNGIDIADVVDIYVVDVADDGMQSVSNSDYVPENYKGTVKNPTDKYIFEGTLEWGDDSIVAVVLKMQTTANNKYADGEFDVYVCLTVAQVGYEGDSFGDDYDEAGVAQ